MSNGLLSAAEDGPGTRLPRVGGGQVWETAQPRSLQEEMGLSYRDGVCPGEEEAAAATPAAPRSYRGREPDGSGGWVSDHRPLPGHFFKNVKPCSDGGFTAGQPTPPKKKHLRKVIIRPMPPSEEVSSSPAGGLCIWPRNHKVTVIPVKVQMTKPRGTATPGTAETKSQLHCRGASG